MYRLRSNCNPALKGHKSLSNGVDIEVGEKCRDGGENLAYNEDQGNNNMRE